MKNKNKKHKQKQSKKTKQKQKQKQNKQTNKPTLVPLVYAILHWITFNPNDNTHKQWLAYSMLLHIATYKQTHEQN